MPSVTDWIMVGITAVYVIATICICYANFKSAKAAKAQLEESRAQFEESRRLQCMPFLQMEISIGKPAEILSEVPLYSNEPITSLYPIFRTRNLGNGTAVNLIYTWKCDFKNIKVSDVAPFNAIRVGDEYYWQFTIKVNENEYETSKAILELQYQDLLGNTYTQNFFISFNPLLQVTNGICIETDAPKFLGIVTHTKL